MGAAVMWSPSYYNLWHRRVGELKSMVSHHDKLDYAQINNIDYVIEVCADGGLEKVVFATGRICVYAVPQTN
jgi:hypothetical protein